MKVSIIGGGGLVGSCAAFALQCGGVVKEIAVLDVNADLAADPALAASQVHRFLVLHKELDPDDDELTRTRKVRRGFIAERYAPLIQALYDGTSEADISTEVTFEDGRKGIIAARVKIRDMKTYPAEAPAPVLEAAE